MPAGIHVGIIMDGNGRWARARGLPRAAGHREGAKAVRRTIEAAPDLGITTLTLYAFSSDNWRRPAAEVQTLMELLERYLRRESARCLEHGVRINVIGRRDRLPPRVVRAVEDAERLTAPGRRLHLRLAIDYSGRHALTRAAAIAGELPAIDEPAFGALINRAIHSSPAAPDVDLLIRTSGEQRLSDFMLWEVAYAELFFTDVLWPAFGKRELKRAVRAFHGRERRFGGLLERAV
ncbi:MAG TPA: polyprenyl diphosphate synthase [Candidatus Polarisedimenticolaceae bacterium]|nr:polyprenyl diphosphate synthase [Candidatus Polarisedimenticolaceae bacterium]